MKAIIEVDMDNAAFEDIGPGNELARILRSLASRLEQDTTIEPLQVMLLDHNGNKTGVFDLRVE